LPKAPATSKAFLRTEPATPDLFGPRAKSPKLFPFRQLQLAKLLLRSPMGVKFGLYSKKRTEGVCMISEAALMTCPKMICSPLKAVISSLPLLAGVFGKAFHPPFLVMNFFSESSDLMSCNVVMEISGNTESQKKSRELECRPDLQ
jgi:hypothetical protein